MTVLKFSTSDGYPSKTTTVDLARDIVEQSDKNPARRLDIDRFEADAMRKVGASEGFILRNFGYVPEPIDAPGRKPK